MLDFIESFLNNYGIIIFAGGFAVLEIILLAVVPYQMDSLSVREENEEDDICTKDNSLNSTSDIIPFARTLLRKYENETGFEEAGMLWKCLWTMEEQKIPLPRMLQAEGLPMLTNALQIFFNIPAEISNDFRQSLKTDINEMIIPLLEKTQDILNSYYEQKKLEVEIEKKVIQALYPQNPFRLDYSMDKKGKNKIQKTNIGGELVEKN